MELQFVHYSEDENNSPAQLVKMNTAWFLFLTLELSFSQYNSCYFLSLELFVNLLSLITIYTECFDVQSFAVLSLTLWEHGIPAEKADIASQGNIPILFDLKHHVNQLLDMWAILQLRGSSILQLCKHKFNGSQLALKL